MTPVKAIRVGLGVIKKLTKLLVMNCKGVIASVLVSNISVESSLIVCDGCPVI